MSTQVTLTANQSAIVNDYQKTYNSHSEAIAPLEFYCNNGTTLHILRFDYLLASFPAPSATYKYKKIESSVFQIFARGEHSESFPDHDSISGHPLTAVFSEADVIVMPTNLFFAQISRMKNSASQPKRHG